MVVIIIISVVAIFLVGTVLTLLYSARTGMPSKDVLDRAHQRARELASKEEDHDA
jgi:hypothetical protein